MNRIALLFGNLLLLSVSNILASAEQSNIGKDLPPLSIESIANPLPAVAGKPMIVEFWATWCGPCRQTIPHLNKLYSTYKSKGLLVVGITKESPTVVQNFMKEIPMTYSVARDASGSLSSGFGIKGIPHALLVDSRGIIVWEGHPAQLNGKIIDYYLGASMSGTSGERTSGPTPTPAFLKPKMAF
jgi:thiol-disulfide isomerase/thioredoxin